MSRNLLPEEVEALLAEGTSGRLGLQKNGQPYVVPLCYYYDGGALYVHGAATGRKADYIGAGGRACFLVDRMDAVIPGDHACLFNVEFRSVLVEGEIGVVEQPEEKLAALKGLAARYGDPGLAASLSAGETAAVTVFRLQIEGKSGRGNP